MAQETNVTQVVIIGNDLKEVNPPSPPSTDQVNSGNESVTGVPSTPSLGRGVVASTTVSKANGSLNHVCDITASMKYLIAYVSQSIKNAVEAVRAYIMGLFAGASSSAIGDGIRTLISAIKSKVEVLMGYVKEAKKYVEMINSAINQIKELINFIMGLPEKIMNLLKSCLTDAVSSLKDAVTNSASILKESEALGVTKTLEKTAADVKGVTQSLIPQTPELVKKDPTKPATYRPDSAGSTSDVLNGISQTMTA